MVSELLRQAQRALAIEDVYVCEASARVNAEFDPITMGGGSSPAAISVQLRVGPKADIQISTYDTPMGSQVRVKYLIETALRLLNAGIDSSVQEPSQDDVLGEINAKFVVRYLVPPGESPPQEALQAFTDNAVHHMWPYWREFLQATTARFRLPPVVIPMRVVNHGTAISNSARKESAASAT